MAVTSAQGRIAVRESTENIPSGRRVRDVSNTIHYLDPNENPFVLLAKAARSRTVFNSKFEWMEKDLPTRTTLATDTSSTANQGVTTGTASRFNANDLILNTTSGEISLVSSLSDANTLVTVRSAGSVAATANVVGDTLVHIGTAYPEGGTLGTPRSVSEGFLYNYTQIFRQPFGTTGTEEVSENYGGRDKARLRKEHGVYHMIDIERAFIFGNAILDTSTSGLGGTTATPWRSTGGFIEFVTTNTQAAGSALTEPEMETFCQTVFTATGSGNSRTLFAAPGVVSVIDQLAAGRLQTVPSTKTYGIAVNQWLTSHGTLNIVKHRLLNATPYTGYALAVDTTKVAYAKMRERDTKLREDVGTPGDDGWTDEYLTECGFEVNNQTAHGILTGVIA